MPFDTATAPDHLLAPRELFQRRREAAVALWAIVPAKNFDLRLWVSHRDPDDRHDCRTVACAIGWLAVREHDGWTLGLVYDPRHPVGQLGSSRLDSMGTVAAYFGLAYQDAVDIFGQRGHAHAHGPNATLADVSAALLEAPCTHALVVAPVPLEVRLGGPE